MWVRLPSAALPFFFLSLYGEKDITEGFEPSVLGSTPNTEVRKLVHTNNPAIVQWFKTHA